MVWRHFRIHICALLLLMLCTVAGAEAAARDADWYRQNGVVVVNPPGAAPMSFLGLNGQPKGYIIDLWSKWSRKTGIPVTFEFAPWAETLSMVREGKADFHGGLFINDERSKNIDFSQPYHTLKAALLVPKEFDAEPGTIYSQYAIGVLKKGYAEYYLRSRYPKARVKTYETSAHVAQGLARNEIRAVLGDHPILGYEIGKLGLGKEMMVKSIVYKQPLHAGVKKGNTTLTNLINEGLDAIDKREAQTLLDRWFVEEVSTSDWIGSTLIIIALILCLLFTLYGFGREWRKRTFKE